MATSSRFVLAVHILTLLEAEGGGPLTSARIAESVNTNPGFIRRLLAQLGRAGLVASTLGTGGGTRLARPAARISLAAIYKAVEERELFALHHSPPNAECPVGCNIQAALSGALGQAEQALERELAGVSVADVATTVGRSRRRAPARGRR